MPIAPETVLRVALPVPLPRLFDYLPPVGAGVAGDWIGCRVRVPFGNGEKVAVVVETGPVDPLTPALKRVLDRLDTDAVLDGELLASLRWTARYYHAPLGEVLATALPTVLRAGLPLPDTGVTAWTLTPQGQSGLEKLRKNTGTRRFAEQVRDLPVSEDQLDETFDDWRRAARALAKRGFIERILLPASLPAGKAQPGPLLNDLQQAAVAELRAGTGFRVQLLEGVTGSGKTEVYLHAIRDCLAAGRQALVLVPEIGLTPQTLARFRARLGVPVHALHSGLGDGERARTWAAMWRGEARVLVGTRSAVFSPLPEAGLIVVDEEHDASYKQQDGIRYHARDLALVRGKALAIPVLLGSATPALESLHNALAGRYQHIRLGQRAGDARPPRVRVVDVRKRLLTHGLSSELLTAIEHCLQRGEQALGALRSGRD